MKVRTTGTMTAVTVVGLLPLASPVRAAEPTTDECLTASDASLNFGSEHKLRAERAQLLICAAASCPADIRKECLRRVDEVNVAIPSIVFEVKDSAGKDLSAVRVTMDGELLTEQLQGTALAVDPGEHKFTFETPGQPPLEKQFMINESQKERREAITFGALTTQPLPMTKLERRSVPYSDTARSSSLGTQRTLALAIGAVGVVGLGVGSVFGFEAMSKKSSAQNVCPNQCADQNGVDKWNSAKSAGNISTVAFIIGGVGIAGAATLWFTGKPESKENTQLSFSPAGLQVKGTW